MRIMGLDYGSKTVGVAMTDPLGITVQPLETILRKEENKLRRTYARIEELVKEYDVKLIVVGLPLNMDDSLGERGILCQEFSTNIERRTGIKTVMQDERLTTVESDDILEECGVKASDRKKYIDQLAAVLILRDYLYSLK